jgi:hypothetical protein
VTREKSGPAPDFLVNMRAFCGFSIVDLPISFRVEEAGFLLFQMLSLRPFKSMESKDTKLLVFCMYFNTLTSRKCISLIKMNLIFYPSTGPG